MIRWESEEAWKEWETSEVHLAGHRANRGVPKLEFILDSRPPGCLSCTGPKAIQGACGSKNVKNPFIKGFLNGHFYCF